MRNRMEESIQFAGSKFCKKIAEQSPVRIGLALGVLANLPLLAILMMIGGVGA